ncbi:MAG: zf-HC2 domain-containing protein [Polyangiaceae bacterium]|nr:zf-HC2 domain-containing protein [Polyangiaceae bacterium]
MSGCPDLDTLLSARDAELALHLLCCEGCRGVRALSAVRAGADCARAESLVAARAAGLGSATELEELRAHLERCAGCRETAEIVEGGLGARDAELSDDGARPLMAEATTQVGLAAVPGVSGGPATRRGAKRASRGGAFMDTVAVKTTTGWQRPAMAAVAAAALTFVVMRWVVPPAPAPASPPAVAVPTSVAPGTAPAGEGGPSQALEEARRAAERARAAEERVGALEERLRALEQDGRTALPPAKTAAAPGPALDPVAPAPSATAHRDGVLDPWARSAGGSATLVVTCTTLCDHVVVDGSDRGPSPVVVTGLAPGAHSVRASRGARSQTRSVALEPGKRFQLSFNLEPGDSGL